MEGKFSPDRILKFEHRNIELNADILIHLFIYLKKTVLLSYMKQM